jgi:glycosyltransferase involved in cell wall biosynthesis
MTASVDVNLLWLVPGRVGGSEEYTVGLLEALVGASDQSVSGADEFRYRLFAQPGLADLHPSLAEAHEIIELPRSISVKPVRFALESSWLAFKTRTSDLVHHGGGVAPFGGARRSIVTVHDLQPLDLPENFSVFQRRWFGVMLPRVARVADRVICPSGFTADRVAELLGFDRSHIHIVSPVHDAAPAHERTTPSEVVEGLASVNDIDPRRFGRYVLLPAMAHPHKRHVDLVEALDLLRGRQPDLHVVFTGAPGSASNAIEEQRQALALEARVHVLGRVDPSMLRRLIAGAEAMVFPSVYEGFGNPVLEAMALNTPVIAADTTALPEVAGGAALLVPPKDPAKLADAIHRLIADPDLADVLRRSGSERVLNFGREVAGQQLIEAYRDALA